MNKYEALITKAKSDDLYVVEKTFYSDAKGLIKNNKIAINTVLPTSIEKTCILAEELGHYYTSAGNILDQSLTENRKQETLARRWAHKELIPLQTFIEAYEAGVRNRYELAELLEVTEEFISEAVVHFQEKYGKYCVKGEYIIYFEPLGVFKKIDELFSLRSDHK